MRRTGLFQIAVAVVGVATLAMLTPAESRPRFGPRAVFGLLGAPLGLFGRALRPHRHHLPARSGSVVNATRGAAALAGAVWIGPLFWPNGFTDMSAYAAGESGAGMRFWSGGFADLLDALMTPPAPEPRLSRRDRAITEARADASGTMGAAIAPRPPACATASADSMTALARRLEERVAPKDSQQAAFAILRQSLAKASEDLACPTAAEAAMTAPARLAAMRERLWAIQSAALVVRQPFADFYASLDDGQKKSLDDVTAARPARRARAASGAAAICARAAATASARAPARIRAGVSLRADQEAPVRTLIETSAGMAQFMVATCPTEPPATALARFDAVLARLDAMLYAISVVATPLDVFYGSLDDDQRARFDALGRRSES